MKKQLFYAIVLVLGVTMFFAACNKDDENDLPEFTSAIVSTDNTSITVTFSEAVYANDDKTGALDGTDFGLMFIASQEVEATFTVDHTAGESQAVINLSITSNLNGDETIKITPADGSSIYDEDGEAMEATTEIVTDPLAAQNLGIAGSWEAYDISQVLVGLGYDDSLFVEFNMDQTYTVTSYINGIAYVLEGTYIQEESGTGNIWNITLNQTEMNGQPSEVTSQGIFEVYTASPDSMWYEVAQTNPEISGVTPPTAEAGFGSTSGGAFGTTNIQKYYRQ